MSEIMAEFLESIESQRGNGFTYVWACDPYQLHCGAYFGTPSFFQTYTQLNLNSSIGGKQASEEPIPVQTPSFDSRFRSSSQGFPQKNPDF